MQYREMKRSVGVAVLLLITLVVAFIGFIIKEKGYLEPNFSYYFVVDDASSISRGTPLNYSGFTIGMVQEIILLDSGKAQMSFKLSEKNSRWIRQNTVLRLKRPLIGSTYIEISPMDANASALEPNSFVKVEMSNDINDIIERLEPIVKKATDIMDNIHQITSYLANEDSELLQSIKHINQITHKVASNDALLTSLTGDQNATQSVIESLEHLSQILANLEKISQDFVLVSASLDPKIVDPASKAIKDVGRIMKDIRQKLRLLHGTVAQIGKYKKELGDARKKISSTIHKSNKVINQVDSIFGGSSDQKVELP
jgi:ABC-type transporter Mla subunit MlaD